MELLVVIGIIALLISILLPALNRVRESGKRLSCQSNLRQLGMGMIMYLNDSRGQFPATAGGPEPQPLPMPADDPFPDWVYWWQNGKFLSQRGVLTKYFKPLTSKILTCPSDPLEAHMVSSWGQYPYSYQLNRNFACDNYPKLRLSQVRRPYDKIMMGEEDYSTLNDGQWFPGYSPEPPPYVTWFFGTDYLSTRHDLRKRDLPDVGPINLIGVKNPKHRGNVLFVDGHVAFVTREYAHSGKHAWPGEIPNMPDFPQ